MIYLLTGVPGSGKSLYAVSTLLKKLLVDVVKPDGSTLKRRLLVDGIPDLLVDHELMAPTCDENDAVNLVDENGLTKGDRIYCTMPEGGQGVGNWYAWCKPGDVIVIDEVQRMWRPRGLGTKPPLMISQLETHRHKGVDFVIVTQNPMLIDQNVRRLVGRHIHVRRLFGMARAVLYDWDGCSVDVHRTKSATSSMWSFPKDGYKLYKSSELHTKQRQRIPAWLIVPVLALVGGLLVAPKAYSVLAGATTGKGVSTAAAPASAAPVAAVSKPGVTTVTTLSAAPVAVAAPIAAASAPVLALPGASVAIKVDSIGCVSNDRGCKCFTAQGFSVDAVLAMCERLADKEKPKTLLAYAEPVVFPPGPVDLDLYAWSSSRLQRRAVAR